MKVNGKDIELSSSVSVGKYLDDNSYNRARIAVELNGDILPKSQYDSTFLTEADTMEIVHFVGGG